jgi:hypothetical protein
MRPQAADELGQWQLELADQHAAARGGDGKARQGRAGRQGEQGFSDLGFATNKQDALRGQ